MVKDDGDRAPERRVIELRFPWPSALAALVVITCLLIAREPALLGFYEIPSGWFDQQVLYLLFGLFVLVLLFDLSRYRHRRVRQQDDIRRMRREIDDLWENRKQLQLKARTYSGHAEKLKLFISDKLLEYIEYDEKFLHFKSIASEVRHNGVISFDKVQTALQQAERAARERVPVHDVDQVHEAQRAMRYLWDLLDLSTADNLALHIANLLCECEEQYYQKLLNAEQDRGSVLPVDPVYAPRLAAWRAASLVRAERLPEPEGVGAYRVHDPHWYIQLDPVSELLGNENHLVLLLENLLRNAQFFSRKRGYASSFASIALTLKEHNEQACIAVYNRGPHIDEQDRDHLFQLGFSTRRAREHHGRGLGLYFVNEIVKGYEGRIQVENVHTPQGRYTLRIETEDGALVTETVTVSPDAQGNPQCTEHATEASGGREWTFAAPVRSVEVTREADGGDAGTQRIDDFARKGRQVRPDPAHPQHPFWQLVCRPARNAHRLAFEPLDISGVCFRIWLPTARQRLASSEQVPEGDMDAEVERLDKRFRTRVMSDG